MSEVLTLEVSSVSYGWHRSSQNHIHAFCGVTTLVKIDMTVGCSCHSDCVGLVSLVASSSSCQDAHSLMNMFCEMNCASTLWSPSCKSAVIGVLTILTDACLCRTCSQCGSHSCWHQRAFQVSQLSYCPGRASLERCCLLIFLSCLVHASGVVGTSER